MHRIANTTMCSLTVFSPYAHRVHAVLTLLQEDAYSPLWLHVSIDSENRQGLPALTKVRYVLKPNPNPNPNSKPNSNPIALTAKASPRSHKDPMHLESYATPSSALALRCTASALPARHYPHRAIHQQRCARSVSSKDSRRLHAFLTPQPHHVHTPPTPRSHHVDTAKHHVTAHSHPRTASAPRAGTAP